MSGKLRIMQVIRRQDYYQPMLDALEECHIDNYQIVPPTGRGHAMLVFSVNGTQVRLPLPGTPNSRSEAHQYMPAKIRRAYRRLGGALH